MVLEVGVATYRVEKTLEYAGVCPAAEATKLAFPGKCGSSCCHILIFHHKAQLVHSNLHLEEFEPKIQPDGNSDCPQAPKPQT